MSHALCCKRAAAHCGQKTCHRVAETSWMCCVQIKHSPFKYYFFLCNLVSSPLSSPGLPPLSLSPLFPLLNSCFIHSLSSSCCFLVLSSSFVQSFFHPLTLLPPLFHFLVPFVFPPFLCFVSTLFHSNIPLSIPALFCLIDSSSLVSSSLLSSSPPTPSAHGHMLLCRWVPVLAGLLLAAAYCKDPDSSNEARASPDGRVSEAALLPGAEKPLTLN